MFVSLIFPWSACIPPLLNAFSFFAGGMLAAPGGELCSKFCRHNLSKCNESSNRRYRVFLIRRPRCLFQTWHGGPGVCLNQFIWARHFLRKGYYLFFLAAVYLTNRRLRGSFTFPSLIPGFYAGPIV